MNTRDLTPGDRRELRSLVKKQFTVLRNDVKRRKDELESEIETELVRRYQVQDEHIRDAQRAAESARRDYERAMQAAMQALRDADPTLTVGAGYNGNISVKDEHRAQLHRALIASVPQQISDAMTKLDQQELDLLRDLTIGALDSDQANQFLNSIPTVGELVPKARLVEIDGAS